MKMEYSEATLIILLLSAGSLLAWLTHRQWKLYNKLDRNIDRNVLLLKKMENILELASSRNSIRVD